MINFGEWKRARRSEEGFARKTESITGTKSLKKKGNEKDAAQKQEKYI